MPSLRQRSITQSTNSGALASGEIYARSTVYSPAESGLTHAPITRHWRSLTASAFRMPWLTFPPTPSTSTVRSGFFMAVPIF